MDHLLASLEEDFDTHLIITSDLRSKMPPLVEKLRERGLKYPKNIDCTPKIKNCQRGREILSYLDEKPNPENIVIIDEGNYDLKEHFPAEKIIHLDHGTKVDDKEYSLNKGHVDNFLISLNRAKPQSDPISSR